MQDLVHAMIKLWLQISHSETPLFQGLIFSLAFSAHAPLLVFASTSRKWERPGNKAMQLIYIGKVGFGHSPSYRRFNSWFLHVPLTPLIRQLQVY